MLVNDSDNLRFYHTSFFSRIIWHRPSIKRSDLKYETINVRLAGIDAPEMAHFGGDCQPFAKEAKDWLTKYVEGKRVTVMLHRFDQYSRAVATVHVGRIWKKNLSVEMVKAGFATIYEDSGAEYGDYEQLLRKYLKEAK
jgi:endonuclease YncB( thermonuclease family)